VVVTIKGISADSSPIDDFLKREGFIGFVFFNQCAQGIANERSHLAGSFFLWHKKFLFVPIDFEPLPSSRLFFIIGLVGTFCYILAKADFFARNLQVFEQILRKKKGKSMSIRDAFFRCYIRLSGYKPKIFTSAEKKELIPKMIEANRKQERDVLTSEKSFLQNLSVRSLALGNCGAWLVDERGLTLLRKSSITSMVVALLAPAPRSGCVLFRLWSMALATTFSRSTIA
jgi:hypothetical protein